MSEQGHFIIADTSVLLSFICSRNHDYLFHFLGGYSLKVPQAIAEEMERKLKEPRFRHAKILWHDLCNSDSAPIELIEDNDSVLLKYIRGFTVLQPGSKKIGENI